MAALTTGSRTYTNCNLAFSKSFSVFAIPAVSPILLNFNPFATKGAVFYYTEGKIRDEEHTDSLSC